MQVRYMLRSVRIRNMKESKLADKIIVREDADIDKIVDKLADKLEKVSKNLGGDDIGYSY